MLDSISQWMIDNAYGWGLVIYIACIVVKVWLKCAVKKR